MRRGRAAEIAKAATAQRPRKLTTNQNPLDDFLPESSTERANTALREWLRWSGVKRSYGGSAWLAIVHVGKFETAGPIVYVPFCGQVNAPLQVGRDVRHRDSVFRFPLVQKGPLLHCSIQLAEVVDAGVAWCGPRAIDPVR